MTDYTPEFLTKLLEEMLLIRRFEEKAAQMYGLGKIGGFCHIYIGQEAVCTGATAAIDLGDIPAVEVHKVTVAVQGFMFSEVVTTEDILMLLANS